MANQNIQIALRIIADARDAIAAVKGTADAAANLGKGTAALAEKADNLLKIRDKSVAAGQQLAALKQRARELRDELVATPAGSRLDFLSEQYALVGKSIGQAERQIQQLSNAEQRAAAVLQRSGIDTAALTRERDRLAASALKAAQRARELAEAERKAATGSAASAPSAMPGAKSGELADWQKRNLGYQLTDIVTGLATGQRPLTVLLQQGGQLRDMFGSVGGAVRGLLSVISPVGVALSAVAAGIYATFRAVTGRQSDLDALNAALRSTGGFAGVTQQQVDALSSSLSGQFKSSTSGARDVLVQLVGTGRVAGDTLGAMGTAVIAYSKVSGKSTDDVAKDFASMSEDVARWAAEHNRSLHFLTAAEFDRIDALQRSGDVQGAMRAVAEALTKSLDAQRPVVTGLAGAWDRLKVSAGNALDKFSTNVGEMIAPGIDAQLAAATAKVDAARGYLKQLRPDAPEAAAQRDYVNQLQAEFQKILDQKSAGIGKAQDDAAKAEREQKLIDAKQFVDGLAKTYRTGGEQLAEAIAQFNTKADALKGTPNELSQAERSKIVAGLTKSFTPAGSTTSATAQLDAERSTRKAALDAQLADLKAAAAERTLTETESLESSRAAWAAYYADLEQLQRAALGKPGLSADQRQKLFADLQGTASERRTKEAELQGQPSELHQRGERDRLQAIAETVRASGDLRAAELQKLNNDYGDLLQRLRNEGVSDAQEVADAWKQARQEAIAADDLSRRIDQAGTTYKDQTVIEGAKVATGAETKSDARRAMKQEAEDYRQTLEGLRAETMKLLQTDPGNSGLVSALERIDDAMKRLAEGSKTALDRMVDGWADAAGNFEQVGVQAFDNVAGALAKVSVGADVQWRDLMMSIVESINKVVIELLIATAVKKAFLAADSGGSGAGGILSAIGSILGAIGGASGGGSSPGVPAGDVSSSTLQYAASGGLITGPGTGTSDSIPKVVPDGAFIINAAQTARIGKEALDAIQSGRAHLTALSNGEYEISPQSVRRYGIAAMQALNGGAVRVRRYATGGLVGSGPASIAGAASAGRGGSSVTINMPVDARGADAQQMASLIGLLPKLKNQMYAEIQAKLDRGIPLNA